MVGDRESVGEGKSGDLGGRGGKRTPILMTEQKELSVFLSDFPQNSNNKITASFSYKDEGDNDVVFPGKGKDKEIPLRRINQGGGTFITPLFPTPNPSREVKVSLSLHTRAKSGKKKSSFSFRLHWFWKSIVLVSSKWTVWKALLSSQKMGLR